MPWLSVDNTGHCAHAGIVKWLAGWMDTGCSKPTGCNKVCPIDHHQALLHHCPRIHHLGWMEGWILGVYDRLDVLNQSIVIPIGHPQPCSITSCFGARPQLWASWWNMDGWMDTRCPWQTWCNQFSSIGHHHPCSINVPLSITSCIGARPQFWPCDGTRMDGWMLGVQDRLDVIKSVLFRGGKIALFFFKSNIYQISKLDNILNQIVIKYVMAIFHLNQIGIK